jgi:hypothetical protein
MKGTDMTYLLRAIEVLLAGAGAIKILHFDQSPSYLVLAFGWACLAVFLIEGAKLWHDLTKTEVRQ